ncbi:DHH family phosphoesterase [Alkalicoccobacillus plakortidis]|uniref:Cyclic-di-AMP phosphodiesterase n=1 Tax=Alkalicoccobacillus plakortidis TaxID=444060 RepID=A0ABT0XKK2_9BACI|nr:DHH family phosphoesterase [Alkalicoccobacillus plakortidis]MCM2676434.1 DHH family phosphoesterase [Alkalicoccobacillus plakortidis]
MPKSIMKRWHGYHVITLFAVSILLSAVIMFWHWQMGLVSFAAVILVALYSIFAQQAFQRDLETYISTLSYRVNKAGEGAVANLPVGMILYNEQFKIQWVNPFVLNRIDGELIGKELSQISEDLLVLIDEGATSETIQIDSVFYHIEIERNERLVYLTDVTEKEETKELFEDTQTVVSLIYLDNYDEVTQGMEDQVRSRMMSAITSTLNQWANEYDIFLRRTASDRFLAVMNYKSLLLLEENKFAIVDEIREVTSKEKASITLSIGVGTEEASLRDLGNVAQSSLDLALGRGGDQVAIKRKNGRVRFYGGKTNAMEKRTRVRARVISHALRDFVTESERVIVMGHSRPDMDAIGASIGVLKIADVNDREGYIVLDQNDMNADVQRLMEEVETHDHLWSQFISPEEAVSLIDKETLLVIVDTHKPSMVIEPKLLDMVDRVVVLDHHRRGEDFINDPVLVYMEPYASSTAELVTELLEYQPKQLSMDRLEATALLAGIIVDTKSFAVRTGARTFDAASFLRSNGADTVLVQKLLKEDLDHYKKRAKLVESAKIYRDGYMIATADDTETYTQLIIAQAADTLLTMKKVVASFVISLREDGLVSISARSLGEVNVQVIMERLNGGGHLSNAATQLEDISVEEAKEQLQQAIDEVIGGDA